MRNFLAPTVRRILLILIAAAPCAGFGQYTNEVLADSPLGYWRLDQTPAYPMLTNKGSLGASADATNFGAFHPVSGALTGSVDTAMQFTPAVGSRVSMGSPGSFAFTTGPFTLEAWVKPNALGGSVRIFSNRRTPTGGGAAGYGFGFSGASNLRVTTYGIADITSPAGSFVTGRWYHIAVVRNGATLQFYTNGVAMGGTVAIGTLNASTRPLQLGRNPDTDLGTEAFDGTIDEAAVYSAALSSGQLFTHYTNGTSAVPVVSYDTAVLADAPIGYWRMNELPATATNSGTLGAVGNGGYFGAVTNGRPSALATDGNFSASFNGTDARIEIPHAPALNTNVFTVELWARVNGGAGTFRSPLSSRNDVGGVTYGYIIYASSANAWEFWTGQGTVGWNTISGPAATIGQWAHLVASFDGTNKFFYVNGALYGVSTPAFATNFARPLRIGAGANEVLGGSFLFNGDIDEVAYFGRALSADRVLAHYTNGTGILPPTVAPSVLRAPQPRTNAVGTATTMAVIAGGSMPFAYQWRLNGSPVADQTNATLSLGSVQAGDAGNYDVIVTNIGGSVTSAVAALYVPPFVTVPPQAGTNFEGDSVTLSVTAVGTTPFTYQWQKNGADIANATNSTLAFSPITPGDEASYQVRVTSVAGSVFSSAASRTVYPTSAPVILTPPASHSVFSGGTARFSVNAGTYARLSYSWLEGGAPLAGATNSSLVLSNVTTAQNGFQYSVVAGNESAFTTSSVAVLTVVLAAADTYASNIVTDAPAGYWRLGQSAGAWAFDSFGGNHGGYSNSVVFSVPGALTNDADTAVRFDGVSAKADVPWAAALNTTNFTVECWARVTNSTGNYRSPITSRADGNTRGYIFYASPANAWEFWTGTGGTAGTWSIMTGPPVTNDQWVHLAGTYDGTTKRFYVNGLLVASTATAFAPNSDRPLRIGAGATDLATGNFYFPGDVDEVVVTPAALPAGRIASHYAAGRARFDNAAPVAGDNDASTAQGRTLTIGAAKLLFDDTDADGDVLSVIGVSPASTNGGSVSLASGVVSYTPAGSFAGTDAFTYTITDGYAATATGTVVVTVLASNALTANLVWGPAITNGNFQVRFAGIPSYTYTVEFTDTIAPPVWAKATNLVAPISNLGHGIGIFEFQESTGVATQRFYRTVYPSY